MECYYKVINTWCGENCEPDEWMFPTYKEAVDFYKSINLEEQYKTERNTAGYKIFGSRTAYKSIECWHDGEYLETIGEETYSKEQFESEN